MTHTDEIQTSPTTPEATPFWRRKPTQLIGAGLAIAALLAAGVGFGAAVADDDNDRPAASQPVNDDSEAGVPASSTDATYGATDAAAISAILTSALNESNGTPTSMEAHRNGTWSVDFEAANGDESTVLVAADGSASVVRTEAADGDDANDAAPAGKLNERSITEAVRAALGEADGVIVGIDLDDKPAEAYSVKLLTGSGAETEIDLSAAFDVTKVEVDND